MTTDNLNFKVTLEAWADIVMLNWLRKVETMRITYSGDLQNSFTQEVIAQSEGQYARIEFMFEYYGKFVDMGVGKGAPVGTSRSDTRRRPRTWFSKTYFAEIQKLKEIIAAKYGLKANVAIIENLEDGF